MTWKHAVLSAALCAAACGGSETEAPAPTPAAPPAQTPTPAPPGITLVPAFEGEYEQMWSPLKQLESLILPIATESAERVLGQLREGGGSAPADSLPLQHMIIEEQGRQGLTLWLVFYTDSGLLQPETYATEMPVREALELVLRMPEVTGGVFNPYTRVSQHEVFNYHVDRLYLAGLIGYLTATPAAPGRHWEAANAAREAAEPFETLHHALLSLADDEDWSQCELAKLWAMWELDFPDARRMALSELEWFIGEGHDDEQTRAMLARFREEATVP